MVCQEIPYSPDGGGLVRAWISQPVGTHPVLAWFDSAAPGPQSSHSYLCIDPFQILESRDGTVFLNGAAIPGSPFAALRGQLARFRLPLERAPTPFAGGAAGFLGYELNHPPSRHARQMDIPDLYLGFYDLVIACDHRQQRSWILSSGLPEQDPARRAARAQARIAQALHPPPAPSPPPDEPRSAANWIADWEPAAYIGKAGRVLHYIRAGDIYQANLTMRFIAKQTGWRAEDLYDKLRAASPSPFAAFLRCGPALALASASPERFVRLDTHGNIEARPIKGTRPRGATPEQDEDYRRQLAASAKDQAENLMIVDLLRHDLGQVARIGSVRVSSLCQVERFASVHHLVSSVEAVLRPGLGPVDVLAASFPGGSVTGAPKIRAMQIIDELEAARRGPYCGAIGWIGFDGAMDSSIAIRTLVITDKHLIAQAGGGVVVNSDPESEYQEALLKAAPLLQAAGGGA